MFMYYYPAQMYFLYVVWNIGLQLKKKKFFFYLFDDHFRRDFMNVFSNAEIVVYICGTHVYYILIAV